MSGRHELRSAALSLKSGDHRGGIRGHQLRRFGIALIGSAPTNVAGNGHGRCERPIDTRGGYLFRGRPADPSDQVRVVRRPQSDVVGKNGGAHDFRMSMHRVDAE